jgi:hypothetical protein
MIMHTQVSAFTAALLFDALTPAPAGQLELARHAFGVDADGLTHWTDGALRAVVPPEGWTDYAQAYPAAGEAIAAHMAKVKGRKGKAGE